MKIMRNLILVLSLTSVLLSSCTLEQSVAVFGALTEHGSCPPTTSTSNTQITSASPKWSSSAIFVIGTDLFGHNEPFFLHPIEYNEQLVFSGLKTKSINPSSGLTNWEVDARFTSRSLNQVLVDDKIVRIENDVINILNLEQGQIQTKYEWPIRNEHLSNSFDVFDDVLYVALQNSHDNYSAIASCEISSLNDPKWSYHYLENSSINFRGCEDIFKVSKGRASTESVNFVSSNQNDILLYFTGTKDDSHGKRFIEKYNLSQNKSEWYYENLFSFKQIEFFDDKLLLGSEKNICALDINGNQIWNNEFIGSQLTFETDSEFIFVDDMIISFGSYTTFSIDIANGDRRWMISLPSSSNIGTTAYEDYRFLAGYTPNTINVYQDKLYYLSNEGQLMIVDLSTGTYDSAILGSGENFKYSHLIVTSKGTVVTSTSRNRPVSFPVPN